MAKHICLNGKMYLSIRQNGKMYLSKCQNVFVQMRQWPLGLNIGSSTPESQHSSLRLRLIPTPLKLQGKHIEQREIVRRWTFLEIYNIMAVERPCLCLCQDTNIKVHHCATQQSYAVHEIWSGWFKRWFLVIIFNF